MYHGLNTSFSQWKWGDVRSLPERNKKNHMASTLPEIREPVGQLQIVSEVVVGALFLEVSCFHLDGNWPSHLEHPQYSVHVRAFLGFNLRTGVHERLYIDAWCTRLDLQFEVVMLG